MQLNTGSVKVLLPKCRQFEGQANGFSRVSHLAPSVQIVIGHSFLYLTVCRNVQLTVSVTKVEWLSVPAVPLTVIV
jgi:hypothetical protein